MPIVRTTLSQTMRLLAVTVAAMLNPIARPQGCDVANRAAGVTRVYAETIGVEAADQVIARLLQRA